MIFEDLNKKKIKYAVLRGHETLPSTVINDVDFGVIPQHREEMENCIRSITTAKHGIIVVDLERFHVKKFTITFKGIGEIKIDIWSDFNFLGLRYLDIGEALNHRVFNVSNIYILQPNYEIALSLLKELLHNKKIREDKRDILKAKYHPATFSLPFEKYFNPENIKSIEAALFDPNRSTVVIWKHLLLNIIEKNIQREGIVTLSVNIAKWTIVRCKSFLK